MPDHDTPRKLSESEQLQRALFQLLLWAHPQPMSIEEVHDHLGSEREAVTRAIRQLSNLGLARVGRLFILATRPAVNAARLL